LLFAAPFAGYGEEHRRGVFPADFRTGLFCISLLQALYLIAAGDIW
jgi:hypothetical protein